MKRRDFFRFAAAAPLAVVPAGLALATPAAEDCKHQFVASWVGTPKMYEWPTPICLHCGFRLPLQTIGVTVNDPGHTHTHSFTGGYTHG